MPVNYNRLTSGVECWIDQLIYETFRTNGQDAIVIRITNSLDFSILGHNHTSMANFFIKPYIAILSRINTVYSGFIIRFTPTILGYMENSVDNALVLLGKRIRTLRTLKGWTQQELGNRADINYKFLGEIERGKQNPSFNSLIKIVEALEVEVPELFRFEQELIDRKTVETRIKEIIKAIPDDALRQILLILRVLYPLR